MHFACPIDARDLASGRDDQVFPDSIGLFSDQAVMMFDTGSVAVFDAGVEYQEVVEDSWYEELDLDASDHQENAPLLELQIGEP